LAYHLQLASDSLFASGVLLNDSTIADTGSLSGPLSAGTVYFWRVRTRTSAGLGEFSTRWRFRTLLPLPAQVQLVTPAAGTSANVTAVGFIWRRASPEVTRYWFEISPDSLFVSTAPDSAVADTFCVRQEIANGTHWWRVKAFNASGWGPFSESRHLSIVTTGMAEANEIPADYVLCQNYPSPFNPSTSIRYGLPTRSHVTLTVFNALGQQVTQMVNGEVDAGYHEVRFNANGLPSGVYFYRLNAGSYVETRKMLLVR
jgi:hypothetical protein